MHVAEEGTRIIQTLGGASVTANAMPDPGSVMAIPALAPGMMVWVGVNENVAVVCVALALEVNVTERPVSHEMAGNFPVEADSRTTGVPERAQSFEVAAAMLAKAACAAVGLVNFVTVKVTWVPQAKVPDSSFTVSTDPVNAACAAVGVVNFVTVTVTRAAAGKAPAVSLMVNT